MSYAIIVDGLDAFKNLTAFFHSLITVAEGDKKAGRGGEHFMPGYCVEILDFRFSQTQSEAVEEIDIFRDSLISVPSHIIRIPVLSIQLRCLVPEMSIVRMLAHLQRINCDNFSFDAVSEAGVENHWPPLVRLASNFFTSHKVHPLLHSLRLINAAPLFADMIAPWTGSILRYSVLSSLELDNVHFADVKGSNMNDLLKHINAPSLSKLTITRCPVRFGHLVNFLWRHTSINGLIVTHLSDTHDLARATGSASLKLHKMGTTFLPNLVSLSGPTFLLASILELLKPESLENFTFLSIRLDPEGMECPRMHPALILRILGKLAAFRSIVHVDFELSELSKITELHKLTKTHSLISSSEIRSQLTNVNKVSVSTYHCALQDRDRCLVCYRNILLESHD